MVDNLESTYHKERLLRNLPDFFATHRIRGTEFPLTLPFTLGGQGTNLNKWAEVLGLELDEAFSVLFDVLDSNKIDTANGINLEKIGKLFNLEKLDIETDELFRNRILNFLDTYKGGGTKEQLEQVVRWFISPEVDNPDDYFDFKDSYKKDYEFNNIYFGGLDRVKVPHSDNDPLTTLYGYTEYFKIDLNIKLDNNTSENFILGMYKNDNNYKLYTDTNGYIHFTVTNSGEEEDFIFEDTLPQDEWSKLTLEYEKQQDDNILLLCRINNILINTYTLTSLKLPDLDEGTLYIGKTLDTDNIESLEGNIHDLKIYGDDKTKHGWWKFEDWYEDDKSKIEDKSINNNFAEVEPEVDYDTTWVSESIGMYAIFNLKIDPSIAYIFDFDVTKSMISDYLERYKASGVLIDYVALEHNFKDDIRITEEKDLDTFWANPNEPTDGMFSHKTAESGYINKTGVEND